LIITTAGTIEGKRLEYLDMVFASRVVGINIFRDFFTKLRDIVGGESRSYKVVINDTVKEVIDEIKSDTEKMGGNAIIGLWIQMGPVGSKGTEMFMVTAYGTAARILDEKGEK